MSVTGSARVGNKLTAKASGITADATVAWQWLRDGKAIKGATTAGRKVIAADAGHRLSARATVSFGQSTVTRTSTAQVAAKGTITKGKVKVSGQAKVTKKLKATVSGFAPSGITLKYRWLRNGKAIGKATSSTYKLAKADKGKRISVKVTASKSGYVTVSLTSAKTRKVAR